MNHTKRFGALALALVMTLTALTGCVGTSAGPDGSSASGSGSASGSASQAEPMDLSQITDPYLAVSGLAGDETLARLGETAITAADYLYWLDWVIENYLDQFGGQMTTLPWDVQMTDDGLTFGQYMLDQATEIAVFHAMLRELARQEGLTPDPSVAADMDMQYADMVVQAGSDESQVIYTFWGNMLTKDLLIKLNENNDLYDQLQELYFGEDSGSYPTDAEVNAYLDENGYFHVKHILLMTIDQDTSEPLEEEAIAQKKATADDLLAQLQASEDPITLFDQLMNQHSEDGGLLLNPEGYIFSASDSLVGGFREAALELSVGEISDVVETDYGYHIMLRLPIDPAEYRAACISSLLSEKIDQERDRLGLEKTAAFDTLDVSSFWDNMQSLQLAIQTELAG
ncbi:MAG: hypothetical protein HFF40_01050 [Lawsonibacter sp.]|jgi:hypothetical protein|nr:hypothetical protein [Lawsonibacter sp.]